MQAAIAEFAFSMQYSKMDQGFHPDLHKDGVQTILDHCLELSLIPMDAPSLHTKVEISQSKIYDSLFPLVSFGQGTRALRSRLELVNSVCFSPPSSIGSVLDSSSHRLCAILCFALFPPSPFADPDIAASRTKASSEQCLDHDIQGEEFCCKLANGHGCALRNAVDVCPFSCADCIDQTTASSFCKSFADKSDLPSATPISIPYPSPIVLAVGAALLLVIVLISFLTTRKAPIPVVIHGAFQYVAKMKSPEETE